MLQRHAGNGAVARLLMAAQPVAQREEATAAPAPGGAPPARPAMAGQLGAVWERGVVVPLARAADRLGREEKDLSGARADVDGALTTIRTVREGTPANDPNSVRLQSVERIVAGVLDVIDARLGVAMSERQFDRELMALRLEAVELQPMVTKKPAIGDLIGAILGEAAADFEVPSGAAEKSAADLWKIFVIDYLWDAQRDFSQLSPGTIWANVLGVGVAIEQFQRAATGGDPAQPRLFALEAGATALLSRLRERIPADDFRHATADDLAADSVRAYQLGARMKGYLTGEPGIEPAPDVAAGTTGATGEPDFTWEKTDPVGARQPLDNDTNLMRPGE